MNILFIHGNYPAQFRSLATDLGKQSVHNVKFLTARKDPEKFPIQGVDVITYEESNSTINTDEALHSIIHDQTCRGKLIQEKIKELIQQNFIPQLIFFHGGNGIGIFLKSMLPSSTIIGYFEWYFSKLCANLILNRNDQDSYNFIRARNITMESEILDCDACVVPTQWQASQFPKKLQPYLSIIFDGIDFDFFKPATNEINAKTLFIEGEDNNLSIEPDSLLLTYATRGMEPMRGFPDFVRALPPLLQELPNLKVIIGGRDRSAYGPACPTHNGSWKSKMLEEIPLLKDHPRITFTGLMNYTHYRTMLQRTNLHCYFTKPYVTSWSLFEAAACGSPILTNRSPATTGTISLNDESVLDNIEDIFTKQGIDKAITLLNNRENRKPLIGNEFSIGHSKVKWAALINAALGGNNTH